MTGDAERREQLVRDASSRWATRRYRAAERLGKEDPEFAVPLLKQLLSEGPTIRVLGGATAALCALDDVRAREALVEALDHSHPWIRLLAAEALARDGEPRAWPVLEAAFESDDIDMYSHALDGLWAFGGERPLALTEQLAREREEEPYLREMAVRTLGFYGTRRSIPAIEAALADRERHVRKSAREAIERIEAREPVMDDAGE